MKTSYHLLLVAISFCFYSSVSAQNTPPKWYSDKGYWVIEGNVKQPKSNVVYFYSNDHQLMYQEKLEGVRINLKRNKCLFRLKAALDKAADNWAVNKMLLTDRDLIATAFRK